MLRSILIYFTLLLVYRLVAELEQPDLTNLQVDVFYRLSNIDLFRITEALTLIVLTFLIWILVLTPLAIFAYRRTLKVLNKSSAGHNINPGQPPKMQHFIAILIGVLILVGIVGGVFSESFIPNEYTNYHAKHLLFYGASKK